MKPRYEGITPEQEAHLQAIENLKLRHPAMDEAVNSLIDIIKTNSRRRIVFLVGPTAAGKTTIVNDLNRVLNIRAGLDPADYRLLAPVIRLRAQSQIPWKTIYIQGLEVLGEPASFINKKVAYTALEDPLANRRMRVQTRPDEANYQAFFFEALKHIKPMCFGIDEAPLLMYTKANFSTQMDIIITLADESEIPIILAGVESLLTFLEDSHRSSQLETRAIIVPLRRYKPKFDAPRNADLIAFNKLLRDFQSFVTERQIKWDFSLQEQAPAVFTYTHGVVGILNDWIIQSLRLMYQKKMYALTWALFEEAARTQVKREKTLAQILRGEKELKELLIDFGPESTPRPKKEHDSPTQAKSHGVRDTRKPGQRNPNRDVIGPEDED